MLINEELKIEEEKMELVIYCCKNFQFFLLVKPQTLLIIKILASSVAHRVEMLLNASENRYVKIFHNNYL